MQLKRAIILCMFLINIFAINAASMAQDETTDTTSTDPQSTVSYFFVVCTNQAVMNLSGTLLTGHDVYYQIFSGAGGTGEALTELRHVEANGDYTFSEIVQFPEGKTVGAGAIASAYVTISREGNPDSSAFNDYVDDIQDGCADPLYELGVSSVGAGSGTSGGTSTILTPFGGFLNPGYTPPAKDPVTGEDLTEFVLPRQQTPGLIFAECDSYPVAEPGIVYDSDEVIVYWSWFASTEEQVQDHIDNVNYSVTYYQTLPLPNLTQTPIEKIGSNYWVFYYSRLGNLNPGQYWIDYKVTWDQPITDGYDDYGPGTENPLLFSGCSFDVLGNPNGLKPSHNTWPYQNYP